MVRLFKVIVFCFIFGLTGCSNDLRPSFVGSPFSIHYVQDRLGDISINSIHVSTENKVTSDTVGLRFDGSFSVKLPYAHLTFYTPESFRSCASKLSNLGDKVEKLFFKQLYPASSLKLNIKIIDGSDFDFRSIFDQETNSVDIYFSSQISDNCESDELKYLFVSIADTTVHELFHLFGVLDVITIPTKQVVEEEYANKAAFCNQLYAESFSKLRYSPINSETPYAKNDDWHYFLERSKKGEYEFNNSLKEVLNQLKVGDTANNEQLIKFKNQFCEPLYSSMQL